MRVVLGNRTSRPERTSSVTGSRFSNSTCALPSWRFWKGSATIGPFGPFVIAGLETLNLLGSRSSKIRDPFGPQRGSG